MPATYPASARPSLSPRTTDLLHLPAVVLATAASGWAFYLSTGLGELWPLTWLAPLPVLMVALRTSGRIAALSAFLAHAAGSMNAFAYLSRVAPLPVAIVSVVAEAGAFAATVVIARYVARRLPPWCAILAFPAAWTSFEFVLSRLSPHGTFFSLGYTQTDFLPVLQLASITGLFGITFLICLVSWSVAVAWNARRWSVAGIAAGIMAAVLLFGIVRLQAPLRDPAVLAGLAATDEGIAQSFATEDRDTAMAVARGYAERVQKAARDGAQVIVLPEKFVGVTPEDAAEVQSVLRDSAHSTHTTVIAGLNVIAASPFRNVADVFNGDGEMITEYDKHHMLPGPESGYRIGTGPALFIAPGAQWGVAICKDMDFPAWLRQYGERGVRILAVPAWDFVRDGRLHSRMAVVRGVENGFSIVRTAQQGLLTISDGYGRILAERASSTKPEALLVHEVPPGPGATFYTRYGDWFGWTSVAAIIALMLSSAVIRRRSALYQAASISSRS